MSAKNSTRLTLIQRICQAHDDEASWEDFVSSYQDYIFVIIRNFGLETELIKDLQQEVMLQLWKDLPRFEYRPGECRFRTWLSRVTCNVIRTYLKSKAGRQRTNEVNFQQALNNLEQISAPEIERIAEQEWKIFIAEKALNNLRSRLSDKLIAVYEGGLEGTSDLQLAADIGITEASVRVYRQRVRNAMLKEISRINSELDD